MGQYLTTIDHFITIVDFYTRIKNDGPATIGSVHDVDCYSDGLVRLTSSFQR